MYYKYLSISNLFHLLNGSVRFTQPKAFNDPFELIPELLIENGEDILIKSIDCDSEPRIPHPALLPDDFESEHCNDSPSRDILELISTHIGILCLSKEYNSLLMWSHYADEYKGAIVGFDSEHHFFKKTFPIQYREHRPKIHLAKMLCNDNNLVISDLFYKSKVWEYENEVRLMTPLSECRNIGNERGFDVYIKDIPIESIKSITLGERTSIEQQRSIFSKIMDTNIELYLSAISNWGYGFRPERIKMAASVKNVAPLVSPRTAHIFSDLDSQLGEIARWLIKNHPLSKLVNKSL